MKYYSNFIFLLVTLIRVQSADSDPNYFYSKLLTTTTTTNRPKFLLTSFPIKVKPPTFSTRIFYEQYYSKTQTKTPHIIMYTPRPYINRPSFDIDMDRRMEMQNFVQRVHLSSDAGYYNKKNIALSRA